MKRNDVYVFIYYHLKCKKILQIFLDYIVMGAIYGNHYCGMYWICRMKQLWHRNFIFHWFLNMKPIHSISSCIYSWTMITVCRLSFWCISWSELFTLRKIQSIHPFMLNVFSCVKNKIFEMREIHSVVTHYPIIW